MNKIFGGQKMNNIINIGILGGDKRQIELANILHEDGQNVFITGFDKALDKVKVLNLNIDQMLKNSEYIVLPIPSTRDDLYFFTPFSEFKTPINDVFIRKIKNKTVFCYGAEGLIELCPEFSNCNFYDYSANENFLQHNAKITADCAIELAKNKFVNSFCNKKVLVCGYGRIGKYLVELLVKENTELFVSVRNKKDFSKLEKIKVQPILTSELKEYTDFDIIFNTVPNLIFDFDTLEKTSQHALLIDLASKPGGVDKLSAEQLNINLIHALGLPGKMAPLKAAEAIKNTIYNFIREEKE